MIRAGIVGIGRWGQTLVRAVQGKSSDICFTRGVTRTPSKVAEFGLETDLPITDDYDALLADPEIDAVVLATPHSQHLDQIVKAAAAGKHIFVEKPIALDAASAARAYRAAHRSGVVLALGHNRRCLPAYRRLQELVSLGALGDLLHIEGNFSGPSAYRQTREGWRADSTESPAGGMTGKGIHITDLMISILGPISEVTASSSRQILSYGMDDTTLLLMRFASGQSASLSTLTATPDDWRLQVYGSKGWAEIRDETRMRVRFLDHPEEVTDFDRTDMERDVLEAFAAAVRDRTDWLVTPRQAVANTALLEAIVTALRNDERTPVDFNISTGEPE